MTRGSVPEGMRLQSSLHNMFLSEKGSRMCICVLIECL